MVVFLTSDLMMASNASSHARQNEIGIKQATSVQAVLKILKQDRPHLLLVDLQCPGLDIAQLGETLGKLSDASSPLTVAFAQHVEVEKLQFARDAGFDQVLTRGQMNGQMAQIIAGGR